VTQETLVEKFMYALSGEEHSRHCSEAGVSRNNRCAAYLPDLSAVPEPIQTKRRERTKVDSYKRVLFARANWKAPKATLDYRQNVLLREIQDRGIAGGISQLKRLHYLTSKTLNF